jgi:hypothetical protein
LKEKLHNEGGDEPADEQQGHVGPQQQDSCQSDDMGMLAKQSPSQMLKQFKSQGNEHELQ